MSENTLEAYLNDVNKLHSFQRQTDKVKSPVSLVFSDIIDFLNWLQKVGLEPSSQARCLSSLRAFYKYLLFEGLVNEDPTELVKSPKLKRYLPSVLHVDEINQILGVFDMSMPLERRNRAMVEVLYACGLRVSELVNLSLANLFFEEGFIKVLGKGNKERLIPIGEEATKQIKLYIKTDRKTVNPKPKHEHIVFLNRRGAKLSRVMVFNIIRNAANKAGIEKRVSPHTFRHSFATHLVEGGANLKAVQDMLGHESITTTEIYTHLNTDYLRETLMQYHPAYFLKK